MEKYFRLTMYLFESMPTHDYESEDWGNAFHDIEEKTGFSLDEFIEKYIQYRTHFSSFHSELLASCKKISPASSMRLLLDEAEQTQTLEGLHVRIAATRNPDSPLYILEKCYSLGSSNPENWLCWDVVLMNIVDHKNCSETLRSSILEVRPDILLKVQKLAEVIAEKLTGTNSSISVLPEPRAKS